MSKKQKSSRNSFSAEFDSAEDDFILIDLDAKDDEDELSPVPLNNFLDDEIINCLLVNSEFEDKLQNDSLTDNRVIDDIELSDNFSELNPFSVGSIDETSKIAVDEFDEPHVNEFEIINTLNHLTSHEDFVNKDMSEHHFNSESNDYLERTENQKSSLTSSEVITSDPHSEHNTLSVEKTLALEVDELMDSVGHQPLLINDAYSIDQEMDDSDELADLTFQQESLKQPLTDYEDKIKRANIITYISLSVGLASLVVAVVTGWIAFNLQSEVTKLTDLNAILKENMGEFTEKNTSIDGTSLAPSVNPLESGLNQVAELDNPQIPSVAINPKKSIPATIKSTTATEIKTPTIEKLNKSKEASTNPTLSTGKKNHLKADSHSEKKMTTTNKQPLQADNPPTLLSTKTQPISTKSEWIVNLIAFKDPTDAKNIAAKYLEKGIAAKVTEIKVSNKSWYQLKVGGFKNKAAANAYADKIKKSLNLNAVSVSKP